MMGGDGTFLPSTNEAPDVFEKTGKQLFHAGTGADRLSGCAADPGARGGVLFSNAAKVTHIYTPEEQANMTAEGTIPTMVAPSELRAYFENANPF